MSSAPPSEKPDLSELEVSHHERPQHRHGPSKVAEKNRIDAIAAAPGTTMASFAHLDEKKILRKMDLRLIPMLALLYLLSFLDRGNIGNAKIEGLQDDLHMSPDQYNWCLTVFFFPYAFFEVPSNLLLKRFRPSRWLPMIMVAWGAVMTLMGIVRNYEGLLAARVFLGVTEAGLYPGCAYYLTMWYCRHEIQLRQAMFFSAASVAGAFSGLLAFAISKMDGVGGLAGWRWIFVLEGMVTVLVAVGAFFCLHDFPETASFLTEEERAFVVFRLKYGQHKDGGEEEQRHVAVAESEEFKWRYVWDAFKDWQIWLNIIVYWGVSIPCELVSFFLFFSFFSFLGSKLTGWLDCVPALRHQSLPAQYRQQPWLQGEHGAADDGADLRGSGRPCRDCGVRIGQGREAKPLCHLLPPHDGGWVFHVSSAQFRSSVILQTTNHRDTPGRCISTTNPKVVYGGVFVVACAIYPAFPGNIAWLSNNLAGSYKRSAGMAIQIGVGNLGGAMASNFYRQKDSPHYTLGHALELGFVAAGIIAAVVLLTAYGTINKKRAKSMNQEQQDMHFSHAQLAEQGDKAVTFRYMY